MKNLQKKGWTFGFLAIILLSASTLETIPELVEKLEAYYKAFPQVRLHLIFSQPKYAPGDTAFFKALFLTEDFRPVPEKQIITLEVKDQSGRNLQIQNFRVTDGEGNNQVVFSESLPPGEYTITAYSEWMKNFNPSLFYRKKITLTGRNQMVKTQASDSLHFFPEGGYLVEGVVNNIMIKSGSKGSGKILNSQGTLVSAFQIGADGMAQVSFTPTAGVSYFATIAGSGQFALPPITDACALRAVPRGTRGAEIAISAAPNSTLRKQELFFLALAKGKVVYSTAFQIDGDNTKVVVENLQPGLNQFYLFDRKDKVLAERIFYSGITSVQARISPPASAVLPRSPIELEISLTDETGRPLSGTFATVAVNQALFSGPPSPSFEMELNLFSDLPNLREDFERTGLTEEAWMNTLNDRLVAQTWDRISWPEVLGKNKQKQKYGFKYSLDMKGKAFFGQSGDAVPDSTQVLIYLQKGMVGYESYTNKRGEFSIPFLYDFWGNDQAFYMMNFKKREKQQDYRVQPELAIDGKSEVLASFTEVEDPYGEYQFKKKVIDRSYTFFSAPEQKISAKIANPNMEFEDELGEADVTIRVEDYLVFPTMPDLIHEVIGGLQVRKINNEPAVRVVFLRNGYTVIPKGDPLYIIDGVFTSNTNFFLSLNPEDIYLIKLVNNEQKLQRLGEMGKYGVVLVQTKKSIAKTVSENSTLFPISGLSKELEFKAPVHSTVGRSRKPDLRPTLFWSPKISLGSNGKAAVKFYASDDAAPIAIAVKGLTSDGRPFSATQIIEVQAPLKP